METRDKRLKSFEIVDDRTEIEKSSSVYVIPSGDDGIEMIVVDDKGEQRVLHGVGGTGDKTFVYTQVTPSKIWTIRHNLNKYPSVTILDTAKTPVEGAPNYISENVLEISFNSEFSGTATLN